MKKAIFHLLAFLLYSFSVSAQGEQNLWTFGNKAGLDFTGATPVAYTNNLFPGYDGSASICDATGQLLFYTNGFWIWNRDHEIMPELTGGVPGYIAPVATLIGYPPMMPWNGGYATQATAIAAMPAHPGKYYAFSMSTVGQLFYSVIDMSLNSGKGGIVAGKKGVLLATNLCEKLTVVNGCNSIWVIARAKTTNQYRAYEINDTGIVTTPVISTSGNLPLSWYRCGVIKFSPDGTKMTAACTAESSNKGGLELYDFNAQTGIFSNALILDSSSTLGYYYGACFSPDNSKLYATTSSFGYGNVLYYGKVRQFNVSLATPAAIIASNTIVFTDYSGSDLDRLGDLKRGRNGKIYFSSGKSSSFIHCINNPDIAGTACNAMANVINLPSGYAERGLPNDIAVLPAPDTVRMTKAVNGCFRDTLLLMADTGKDYHWQNGNTGRTLTVTANGTYVVTYINLNCKYEIDTFRIRFVPMPVISPAAYSCPSVGQAVAWVVPQANDTTMLNYSWTDGNGNLMQQHWSNRVDTLRGIDTGLHYLQITTLSGCDTTLNFTVLPLPVPMASFVADTVACKGVALPFTNTSAAPLWKWHFGDGNYSTQQNPSYSYSQMGRYTVSLVVTNIEGCSDTAHKDVRVEGLDLILTADKNKVNKGDVVELRSSGSELYTVSAWEPAFLFPNQSAVNQSVSMDTTRTFFVAGVSAYGCKATASVEIEVNPIVFMPTAFTPNGDGVNDRFRPISSGYIFVRYFQIYNRYGQMVYTGFGKSASEGWDGTYNNQLLDLGVFYYQINIETKDGGTISLKGDVTLIR